MRTKETELAWAAGFFDGEGCAFLHKLSSGRAYARLGVYNTFEPNIIRFYNAIDNLGGICSKRKSKENYKDLYVWQSSKDTRKIYELLSPYLSDEKLLKIEEILSLENRDSSGMSHKGEDNAKSKLKKEQVLEIIQSSQRSGLLEEKYGVHKSTIKSIRNGKLWKHLDRNIEVVK